MAGERFADHRTRNLPSGDVSAGHSGHHAFTARSHWASFWRKTRSRLYSFDPSCWANPVIPKRGTGKTDHAASLENSEGGDPHRDETVLAKGQAVTRMADDLKSELAVAPSVSQLVRWGPPQGNTTKDEWPGVVGDLLFAVRAFLTH